MEIRQRVSIIDVAAQFLTLRRAGREWKARCPFHPDRTPSFTIYAEGTRFMCFGCGAQGDVLDFVMRQYRIGLPQAVSMLRSLEKSVADQFSRDVRPPSGDSKRSDDARAIWNRAVHAEGTTAEAYLRSRGVTAVLPESVRFLELPLASRAPMPALVAAVSNLSGEVTGIQRTFLSANPIGKAPLPGGKVKFSLGRVLGGAIRLSPAERSLIVTEGLEDGLTVMQALNLPVWVAAGAGMLPSMQVPDSVRVVVIAADNDPAGQSAATKAAEAFETTGRRVRIMRPASPYKDFNAWLADQRG